MSSTSQFRSFDLPGLLPPGHALIVNQQAHLDHFILSQLSDQVHGLVAQQVFSELELFAIVALMEAWPEYCSYEHLLSTLSDLPLDQARAIIHATQEARAMDKGLNPLRNLLTRCRARMHDFGIDIRSVRGLGYQLARTY